MKKAFTLVELLVALSIMALIMGASLTAFESTKKSARDGRRKADLESLRSALEIYRSDLGTYPNAINLLSTGNYISAIPVDPTGASYSYNPVCTTNCLRYYLCSTLEIQPNPPPDVSNCSVTCGTNGCKYITANP